MFVLLSLAAAVAVATTQIRRKMEEEEKRDKGFQDDDGFQRAVLKSRV